MKGETPISYEKERWCLLTFAPFTRNSFDKSLPTITVIRKQAYFGDKLIHWSTNAKVRLPGFNSDSAEFAHHSDGADTNFFFLFAALLSYLIDTSHFRFKLVETE